MKLLMRILKNEAGQALPMALILLVLGGLLVVPTLGLVSTSLNANRQVDTGNLELYAADAGVEQTLWRVNNDPGFTLPGDIAEHPVTLTQSDINDRTIVATMSKQGTSYRIRSTATSPNNHSTTVECYLNAQEDFSWLFDHAITCEGDIDTHSGDIIYGGVLCGGELTGPGDIRTGDVTEGATITLPTEEQLSAFYLAQVDSVGETEYYYPNHGYSSSTISVSGYTRSNPKIIPPMYRNGELTITGYGYGKLSGTIYLTGTFKLSKGSTLDLNGQTVYSTEDSAPDCKGSAAIYFQDNSVVYGPGCVIGVGDVNFQPQMAMGAQLVGVCQDTDTTTTMPANTLVLAKFQAEETGKLTNFQVKCNISDPEAPPAHLKVAIYRDSDGLLLNTVNSGDLTIESSWNPINFEETQINAGTWYWMAAISDSPIIVWQPYTSSDRYKYRIDDFSVFNFPQNLSGISGLSGESEKQYMMRGYAGSQEFLFIMSLKCETNFQPGATFYGCIAGKTTVNLQPHCTMNLVGQPAEGLDFPGAGPGGSSGGGGTSTVLSYTIVPGN